MLGWSLSKTCFSSVRCITAFQCLGILDSISALLWVGRDILTAKSQTQTQNKKVNGNGTTPINNYLKCKWVECPNKKTKTGWMDTKTRPQYMLPKRDPLQNKGHIQTESEGLGKRFHANGDQKKAGVTTLISDKIDFQIKDVKRDKEGHYIMIKGSFQEEGITVINIYAHPTQEHCNM